MAPALARAIWFSVWSRARERSAAAAYCAVTSDADERSPTSGAMPPAFAIADWLSSVVARCPQRLGRALVRRLGEGRRAQQLDERQDAALLCDHQRVDDVVLGQRRERASGHVGHLDGDRNRLLCGAGARSLFTPAIDVSLPEPRIARSSRTPISARRVRREAAEEAKRANCLPTSRKCNPRSRNQTPRGRFARVSRRFFFKTARQCDSQWIRDSDVFRGLERRIQRTTFLCCE